MDGIRTTGVIRTIAAWVCAMSVAVFAFVLCGTLFLGSAWAADESSDQAQAPNVAVVEPSASASGAGEGAVSENAAGEVVETEEIEDEDTPMAAELRARRTASIVGGNIQTIIMVGIIIMVVVFGGLTYREHHGISAMRRRIR